MCLHLCLQMLNQRAKDDPCVAFLTQHACFAAMSECVVVALYGRVCTLWHKE